MAQLKISSIYIGERRRKDLGDIDDMMADLKENGQITPITVRPPNSEEEAELIAAQGREFLLVAGGRRTVAATLLGWEFIEAFTRTDPIDELKHRVLELQENLQRKEMTWDEIAQAKAEMLEVRQLMATAKGETITQAEIARELGESPATFSRDVEAAEAIAKDPSLKKAGSRKAALRHRDMAEHNDQLFARMRQTDSAGLDQLKREVRVADARDYLRQVEPRSVDLILTDPPYGIDYFKQGHKMRSGGADASLGMSEYDDRMDEDLFVDIVPLWAKVLRETGWMLIFCGEELEAHLRKLLCDCCAEHADYREPGAKRCNTAEREKSSAVCRFFRPEPKPWIWYRPNSRNNPRYPERHAKNMYENILVVAGSKARLSRPTQNMFVFDGEYGDDRIHAMQKPVILAEQLTLATTNMGDTVLDCFMGSGALLAGATSCIRHIMGCEKNESIFPAAMGHISKYFKPTTLRMRHESEKRYNTLLESGEIEGVDDFSEVEDNG